MAYQSLYRRYRPRRFADVRGQEHVIRALRNAVRDERVGHAYLFSGPRGTGKTSTARILAKALNCEHLVEGEPDGTCDSCLAIDAGTSYDVQELDAASNNGVEAIRDLIGRVALGSPGRTKVYILDEVHMLSAAASATLLKTLEEPPAHVVFVLATTDPQKVLPTIRSRTQHFDFHLLSVEELSEHVAWVIHDAQLGLDPDVIAHVVRLGEGSARDTLSALETVAASGGVIDKGQSLDDLLDAIAGSDTARALLAVADAISTGRDPRLLGENVLARLRDVFLLRMGGGTDHLPPGDIERVRAWADQLGDRATTRALEAVGDALQEMRQAPDPRIPLEVALVKITKPEADASIDGLLARIARLEEALAAGGLPASASAGRAPAPAPAAPPPADAAPAPADAAPVPARVPAPATPSPRSSEPTPADPVPPGRAAPPPRPGARPADLARAQLAANRSGKGSPARPVPSSSEPGGPPVIMPTVASPGPSAPPSPSRPPDDERPPRPAPSAAAAPVAAPAPATPAPAGGGLPDKDALTALWNEHILPTLRGMTKAMYAVGRFVDVSGATATLAFPNEAHRQKCEQKRAEVEAALAERLGSPVRLKLVVDEAGDTGGEDERSRSSAGAGAPAGPGPQNLEDLGVTDVHDLDDAPDAPSGGLDALAEAFPGSELVEGP